MSTEELNAARNHLHALREYKGEIGNADSNGTDDRSLRASRRRASRPAVRSVGSQDVARLTLTVVIPAHNEEECLAETLDALMRQTMAPERIIVVDDGSSDNTYAVASEYPVELVRNETALGSKARVVNHVAAMIDSDLIINIDGDTVLADDYIARIKEPFLDPTVAVAAGIVLTWNPKGPFQRGRSIEYLFGQTLFRPIQQGWSSITVAPGCACVIRRSVFVEAGGFPDGTIAEDMSLTWDSMIAGHKAVYVSGAEAYVVDPKNAQQLKAQLWRWLAGYFQCVRVHWKEIIRHKRLLAALVIVSIWDIFSMPILIATPLLLTPDDVGLKHMIVYVGVALIMTDVLVTMPVVMYGAYKRNISLWWTLANLPFIWVMRPFNLYYATKAMVWELFLVPCEWKTSLSTWIKGH